MENTSLEADRKVVWTIASVFVLMIGGSTVLHHFFPAVLDVPPNTGVPYTGYAAMFLLDLIPITLACFCFYHALRRIGLYGAVLFLAGSFFFTGTEENLWIFIGRYIHVLAAIDPQFGSAAGTYYFTRGFFWWLEIPVTICLGWFSVAYSCVYISGILFPKRGLAVRSALAGFLAMDFDLWIDPVQVHPAWQSWKWLTNEPLKIFSIPLTNFVGWFLLIFVFAVLFDRLARMKEKWGAGKAAGSFFLILAGLDAAIILLFMLYGYLAMRYITQPVNLTLWGI